MMPPSISNLPGSFLTARWSKLVMLNFAVPRELIAEMAPEGTEPDLFEGEAFASVVGFWFRDTRVLGAAVPGHKNFQEVNLRFYVRREIDREVRRGVVFAREIVPRRAIALVANWLYDENYVAWPMASDVRMSTDRLSQGDLIEYRWQTGRGARARWNRLGGRVAEDLHRPEPGSFEEFIVEHYWGYAHGGRRATREYRVEHVPWQVAAVDDVVWDCDLDASYGGMAIAKYLDTRPTCALVADGSPVKVRFGRRVGSERCAVPER